MKKKVAAIVLGLSMCISMTGCSSEGIEGNEGDITPTNNVLGNKYFDLVNIYENGCTNIVYDKNTSVMYFLRSNGNSFGITPIYNSDGTLKLYEGE